MRIGNENLFEEDVETDNPVWISASGEKWWVEDMGTQHIINIIECWNGRGKSEIKSGYLGGKKKWLKIFNDELIRRYTVI